MVTLRRLSGLAVLAGMIALVAIPAAEAKRSGIEVASTRHAIGAARAGAVLQSRHSGGDPGSNGRVKAAEHTINQLLRTQDLAAQRNLRALQQRDRFVTKLLQLNQTTPSNPREARLIQQAIGRDTLALNRVNGLLTLSRQHLLNEVPGITQEITSLSAALAQVAANNPRVAGYLLFAMRHQQGVLAQLQAILNAEEATASRP